MTAAVGLWSKTGLVIHGLLHARIRRSSKKFLTTQHDAGHFEYDLPYFDTSYNRERIFETILSDAGLFG